MELSEKFDLGYSNKKTQYIVFFFNFSSKRARKELRGCIRDIIFTQSADLPLR